MSKIVYRPRKSKTRISSKDEFELCYIRHRYFRKTLYNPTVKDMAEYENIVKNLSRKTFYTYRNLLGAIGFDREDVENVGRIHLVSFLGLFSLESDPGKYAEFSSSYGKTSGNAPDPLDILSKNRANFTLFLKQRMEELIRICRQKVDNVKGPPAESLVDFSGSGLDPYDNIHNMTPEQILFHKEEEDYWEQKKRDFGKKSKDDKIKMISQFVKNNSDNPHYEEEIRTAERYLKRLGVDLE